MEIFAMRKKGRLPKQGLIQELWKGVQTHQGGFFFYILKFHQIFLKFQHELEISWSQREGAFLYPNGQLEWTLCYGFGCFQCILSA